MPPVGADPAVAGPLLECNEPRFSGVELGLGSFSAQGSLLVLVGAWAPLFELVAGFRQLAGGRVCIAGQPAEGAAARGHVGLARRDAPLPPSWPVRDVLAASAELLGESRRRAVERAREVLGELGLEGLAGKRVSMLRPAEQRVLSIAAAALGAPAVLAIEEPFAGLEPSGQAYVDAVIGRALSGRAGLVSVAELPGTPTEDAFAARGDELLFVSGRRLVARGSYRELSSGARSHRVVVRRSVDALLARLGEAGYEVRRMSTGDATTLWLTDRAGLGTLPLFRAALAADAPIVELVPFGLPAPPPPAPATAMPATATPAR
jgi:ABC-type multidrug transport system ATPase subunit